MCFGLFAAVNARVGYVKAGTILRPLVFWWFIWTGQAIPAPIPYACERSPELSALASGARDAEMSGGWQMLEDLGARAVKLCPQVGEGYHWLGLAHLRRGGTFAAVRAFRAALIHGDDATTHLRLAEAYFVLNQHQFFAEEIAAAKSKNPTDAEAYYVEGRFLFQTKNLFAEATEQFRQALSRDPQHIKALSYLALSLKNMQQDAEAEQQLQKGIQVNDERNGSFFLPYQALASLYLEQNRAGEALSYIQRAVKMAPSVAENQFLLGKVGLAQNDGKTAESALRTAMALDESLIEARYLLARIYQGRGDSAAANRELEKFKELKEIYGTRRLR